jgi:uncharacterized protein (DUF4415 family)
VIPELSLGVGDRAESWRVTNCASEHAGRNPVNCLEPGNNSNEHGAEIMPRKQAISLRIDADVLAWSKVQGADYETRINELPRAYMDEHNERQT